jgi:hypothetical protein
MPVPALKSLSLPELKRLLVPAHERLLVPTHKGYTLITLITTVTARHASPAETVV